MTLSDVRAFTPAHWIMVALAGLCLVGAVALVGHGLGLRWDPFNMTGRRAAAADRRADAAADDGAARSIEAAGADDTLVLVEAVARQRARLDSVIADSTLQAKAAPDANEPLDPDRALARRHVDDQLCALSPRVCGGTGSADPAAADHAGLGLGPLQPAPDGR